MNYIPCWLGWCAVASVVVLGICGLLVHLGYALRANDRALLPKRRGPGGGGQGGGASLPAKARPHPASSHRRARTSAAHGAPKPVGALGCKRKQMATDARSAQGE